MAAVRSLLARIAKLEQAKVSPVLRLIGSIEQFEANALASMANGFLDRRDMPVVLASVQRWVREGL